MQTQPMLLVALTLAALTAAPAAAQEQEPAQRLRTRPNLITVDEIQQRAPEAATVYDVIQRLRPRMLQIRPAGDLRGEVSVGIQVYVDGIRLGGVDLLRTLPATSALEIQHLSGTEASARFGLDHESGAILIKTSRPGS